MLGLEENHCGGHKTHHHVFSDSTWENRRHDSLDMMHGMNCSGDMGEEDFYDEDDDDIEDGDEEEISVT